MQTNHIPVSITPSDDTTYSPPLRGFYVGGTGNVIVTNENGSDVTFVGVAAGVPIYTGRIVKIKATGTTATNIVGFTSGEA